MSQFKPKSAYLTSLHDGELLPYLQKEVDKTDGNLFFVIHTYGSHFNYHERYPKDFAFYTPDKAEGIRASYKKQLRNSYDNSIHYTDYVLGEITDMMKKTDACVSMLYLSDHGEDIFDDARARYLHASPIPTYYQLHIPYIIWFSDAYRATYPEKYQTTMAHQALPVSTNSVFHTVWTWQEYIRSFRFYRLFPIRLFTVRDRSTSEIMTNRFLLESRIEEPTSRCWTNGELFTTKIDILIETSTFVLWQNKVDTSLLRLF